MDTTKCKMPPNRTRPCRITVRMSHDEFAKYNAKLAKSNMSANSYNIKCLTDKPIIQSTLEEVNAMVGVQKALAGVGNNINQLTRLANSDCHTPSIKVLESIKQEVYSIWQLLKRAKAEKH